MKIETAVLGPSFLCALAPFTGVPHLRLGTGVRFVDTPRLKSARRFRKPVTRSLLRVQPIADVRGLRLPSTKPESSRES